jgi:hypothetical protein
MQRIASLPADYFYPQPLAHRQNLALHVPYLRTGIRHIIPEVSLFQKKCRSLLRSSASSVISGITMYYDLSQKSRDIPFILTIAAIRVLLKEPFFIPSLKLSIHSILRDLGVNLSGLQGYMPKKVFYHNQWDTCFEHVSRGRMSHVSTPGYF